MHYMRPLLRAIMRLCFVQFYYYPTLQGTYVPSQVFGAELWLRAADIRSASAADSSGFFDCRSRR